MQLPSPRSEEASESWSVGLRETAPNNPNRLSADEVLRSLNEEWLLDFCEPLRDVNQVGTFGNRPIHIVSHRGPQVIALVDAGADVNAIGDLGTTALHEAVDQGHVEVVRFLVTHGARADIENELGNTAVQLVAHDKGRADVLAALKHPGNG